MYCTYYEGLNSDDLLWPSTDRALLFAQQQLSSGERCISAQSCGRHRRGRVRPSGVHEIGRLTHQLQSHLPLFTPWFWFRGKLIRKTHWFGSENHSFL